MSKKIRIFAGPNGSGKTSLFNRIQQHYHYNIGIFINPDIVESVIKEKGELPFSDFKIDVANEELLDFFQKSTLAERAGIDPIGLFEVKNNIFILISESYSSYLAAIISEFIRLKLFDLDDTFSTETVMSDPSKIDLIKTAKKKGFKVYLYYITTDDVIINIERINSRVQAGGHSVPLGKIKDRYVRSLDLLYEGIKYSDRVFLVDSTEFPIRLIAEINQGDVSIKCDRLPNWFIKNVEAKILENRNPDSQ